MKSKKVEIAFLFVTLFMGIAANTFPAYGYDAKTLLYPTISPTGYPGPGPVIRYVKRNAAGANNGTSWTNAYTDLQSALSAAASGDEIWVAKGTYKPTTGTDRKISFGLKNDVAIYGGFAGTETLRAQRNPAANVTVLSGEIGAAGNADNSYNVVVGGVTNNTAVLDGFTVAAGNANGANPFDAGGGMNLNSSNPSLANVIFSNNLASFGGGMYNDSSNPTLLNVTFIDNMAEDGGGMYNFNSSPSLLNAIFIGNTATVSSGGGILNFANSSPTLTNVEFSSNSSKAVGGGIANQNDSNPSLTNVSLYNNSAGDFGGGMANSGSSPTLINVTFSANKAAAGGGIGSFSSSPTVTTVLNSILWGDTGGEITDVNSSSTVVNFSIVQGGYSGTGNLNSDPLLGALANNGGFTQTMRLGAGSPAIDTGKDIGCPATDQRGVTRPQGSHCDIGAFEFNDQIINGGFNTYPTTKAKIPTSWKAVNFSTIDGKTMTVKKEGIASVRITGTGVTKTLSQTLLLSGSTGDAFTFSYWVKGNAIPVAGVCRAQILFYNGTTLNPTKKTINCGNGTYAFKQRLLTFTALGDYTKIVVRFTYSKASGRAWFDAVSLTR